MVTKEIKKQLAQPFTDDNGDVNTVISSVLRGNILWSLWEKKGKSYIVCHEITKGGEEKDWKFKKKLESDPPDKLNCPLRYLTRAEVLNENWRKEVINYVLKPKIIRKEIIKLFDKAPDGMKVRVLLTPDPGLTIKVEHLDIIKVKPRMIGLYNKNRKRYYVPARLVSEMIYLKKWAR